MTFQREILYVLLQHSFFQIFLIFPISQESGKLAKCGVSYLCQNSLVGSPLSVYASARFVLFFSIRVAFESCLLHLVLLTSFLHLSATHEHHKKLQKTVHHQTNFKILWLASNVYLLFIRSFNVVSMDHSYVFF